MYFRGVGGDEDAFPEGRRSRGCIPEWSEVPKMYSRSVGGAEGAFPDGRRSRRCIPGRSEEPEMYSRTVGDKRYYPPSPISERRKCP